MFFNKSEEIERLNKKCYEQKRCIDHLEDEASYYEHIHNKRNRQLENMCDGLKTELNKVRENASMNNLVLLICLARSTPGIFLKNRIDSNLNGSNDTFFLHQLGNKGYYTWILDMKYWDMFSVEIGLWDYNEIHDPEGLINV